MSGPNFHVSPSKDDDKKKQKKWQSIGDNRGNVWYQSNKASGLHLLGTMHLCTSITVSN